MIPQAPPEKTACLHPCLQCFVNFKLVRLGTHLLTQPWGYCALHVPKQSIELSFKKKKAKTSIQSIVLPGKELRIVPRSEKFLRYSYIIWQFLEVQIALIFFLRLVILPSVHVKALKTTNEIQPMIVIKQWMFDSFLSVADQMEVFQAYLPDKLVQQLTLITPLLFASGYYWRGKREE